MTYGRAAAAAGAAGAAVGLSAFGLSVLLMRSYGGSLFIGAPPIGGFVSGFLFARSHRPRVSGAILSAMLAILLAGIVVIAFAFEGPIFLAMALPLVALGAMLGACIACLLQRCAPGRGMAPTARAVLLLPLTLTAEGINPLPRPEALPIESSIVVNAPMDTVWRQVVAFPPLPPPTGWLFRAGIAAPMGAAIEGEGSGAVRRCIFTTGTFIEPIETWSPPRELSFAVASSPEPMREWTLWDGPKPLHLDSFLQSTRGQFILETLPGERTRLVGRTWYRTNMVPESYWRLWADAIIHAIHMRVLRHVAALSETAWHDDELRISQGSKLDHAAVDHELGPHYERGFTGGEVEDRGGDLVRVAESLERNLLRDPFLELPRLLFRQAHAVENGGGHRSRADDVHAHAVLEEVGGQGLRQVDDGSLGGPVDARARHPHVRVDRRVQDHGGPAGEERGGLLNREEGTLEVGRDRLVEALLGHGLQ